MQNRKQKPINFTDKNVNPIVISYFGKFGNRKGVDTMDKERMIYIFKEALRHHALSSFNRMRIEFWLKQHE